MKIILSSCLMPLFVLAGAPAQAIEPFALLDDFLGDRIDNTIWSGIRRPDADTLDVAREVQGGELRLMGRTYADTPVPGERNSDRVRLFLNNSAPVTQMAARVRVKARPSRSVAVPTVPPLARCGCAWADFSLRPAARGHPVTGPTTSLPPSTSGEPRTRSTHRA